ncbi:DUF4236 domain-containing protein [Marinomonas fungiae]|uniref:DUF4236 domain-containing protein n=1 Tax=Marinomonas fungiae TaxID=1137284 RepID=A0A0K6IUA7_9GAMM|nr:DUF4236 domain-containing protein [Marinomonas fungiae]CUB06668.1 Protein of unknown function (DUF4236) [Marinomonas fungiae]
MGFRFRRSITIIPGIRLNLSNGLPSLSVGPRGASISVGKRGTYANLGLGGGLSYRTRLDRAAAASNTAAIERSESKEELRNTLQSTIEQMESATRQIINVHTLTPNPAQGHSMNELRDHYVKAVTSPYAFAAPERPEKPVIPPAPIKPTIELETGFLKKLFESQEDRQERYEAALAIWERSMLDWEREKALVEKRYQSTRMAWAEQYALWQFESSNHQAMITTNIEIALGRFDSDSVFFETILDDALQNTDWPRDTSISFEVLPEQSLIKLDVDLPEIEDLPQSYFILNRQRTEIVKKEMTQKAIRETYARHVHGILMRLIGIALYALPFERVSICGFTQRVSKATGNLVDDYIIECDVDRSAFQEMNFSSLDNIDPIVAISRFNPNRKMSTTYVFQSITVNGFTNI